MNKSEDFAKGADISLLKRIEDAGGVYRQAGKPKDALDIFKDNGFNYMRLRLFHTPSKTGAQVNDLAYTLALAERIKKKGFKFLLDFHYSDGWADPGKQIAPAAWKQLSHSRLVDKVFEYTREVISACRSHNCQPDMVQIGNEVTPGMLWEDGRVTVEGDTTKAKWQKSQIVSSGWKRFAELLKAGISGTLSVDKNIRTMIHIDRGGDSATSEWFFDNLLEQDVDFDVIGQSYHPYWHGPFEYLQENLNLMAGRYRKDIYIVETGYPWKAHPEYDRLSSQVKADNQQLLPYPISPQGQKAFLEQLISIIKNTPDGRGGGIFYWSPEWIEVKDQPDESDASVNWTRALFDEGGNTLPAITAFL